MYGNENNLYVHNFEFDMRYFIIYNVVLNIEIQCVLGGLALLAMSKKCDKTAC